MESSAILQLHYLLFRIRRLGTFATTHLYFFLFNSLYTSLDKTRCLLLVIVLIYYYIVIYIILLYDTLTHSRTTRYASWRLHFCIFAWFDLNMILLLCFINYYHYLFVYLILKQSFCFLKKCMWHDDWQIF